MLPGHRHSKGQDGTYLFKGGQEHVGVASHFHNYRKREEGAVRTGLNPSSAPYPELLSFLAATSQYSQLESPKPMGGSSSACLPLPGGTFRHS